MQYRRPNGKGLKPLDGDLGTPKTTSPLSWAAFFQMRRWRRPNDPHQRSDVFKGEGVRRSGGAAPRLSDSYQLGMTRPQRIAVTAFLSALFVPSLFLLPVWCLKSEGMRSLLWNLSYSTPPLVTSLVTWAIPLIVFAVLCSVFAWVVARIWR